MAYRIWSDRVERSWIAISGNREEYYMNCAAVDIVGSGSSKLETFPDMFVGEMLLPPNINENECRTTEGFAMEYPNPGEFKTVENVPNIGFKKPTDGKCYAPGCNGANGDTPKSKDSASPSKTKTISSPLQTINVDLKSCKCVCSV